MIDLSATLDDIRDIALEHFRGVLNPWPVLHLVVAGETSNENFCGVGPWARIWALPSTTVVQFPKNYKYQTRLVSYVVAIYVPRVFTTDNLLETILHEYLHIGKIEGDMNYHLPREEVEFIKRSVSMAKELLDKSSLLRSMECVMTTWDGIRQREVFGLTVPTLDHHSLHYFNDPIKTELLCLTHLE